MKPTFMSFSFGCRVNEAEKQLIDNSLMQAGFSWDEMHPSFYIINSCAVTGKAEREVRQHIYQIRKKFPDTNIIATGCSATLWIKKNTLLSEVDYWIDNGKKSTIPQLLRSLSEQTPHGGTRTMPPDKFLHSGRMMVKIQEGCKRYCSYCIVPYLRETVTSETVSNIVKLILTANRPIKEVILTAINTEHFGKDTGETLMQLVDMILKNTKVERVSFGSIHPWSITSDFLSWYEKNKNNPRFVHFFHIPVQSGSEKIITLMNRQYSIPELMNRLIKLHEINPHALIATDVIVGFPGESEKEFLETYEFLKESPISKFHVFRYSPRPGTQAEKLSAVHKEPAAAVKKLRAKKLIDLGLRKYQAFLSRI